VRRSALGSCMLVWRTVWVSQGNWELQFVRLPVVVVTGVWTGGV
jgi:hypothetical protein